MRRGATKTSHRDGTGCDLRRCGGGPPLPPHGYTFQPDFHRDFFPAFNQTTPKPKLPRLLVVGCVTRANLGWPRAGSVNSSTHTLALAHRLGGAGFAPPPKQFSKACRRDNNSQAYSRMPPSCNRLAELIPSQPYRLGKCRIVYRDFTSFSFFLLLGSAMTDRDRETQNTHHTLGV